MNLDVTENKLPDLNDLQLEDKWIDFQSIMTLLSRLLKILISLNLVSHFQTCTISFGRTSVTGISSL